MSRSPVRRSFQFAVVLILAMVFAVPVHAANLQMEAKLVWGSNEQSKDPKHIPVDPALAEKLKACFKWKYYYLMNTVVTNVPSRATRALKMSDPCTIEITELEGPRIE